MMTVRILLGGSDRQTNNCVEAILLDICYEQAHVEFTRMNRLKDFVRQASYAGFDLIVVAPKTLVGESARQPGTSSWEEFLISLRDLKRKHSTPVLVAGVPVEDEAALMAAGADAVVGRVLRVERLRSDLQRLLGLPERVTQVGGRRWTLTGIWTRLFPRPHSA